MGATPEPLCLEVTGLARQQNAASVTLEDHARQDRSYLAAVQSLERSGRRRCAVDQLEVLHGRIAQRELAARVQLDRFARRQPAHLGDLALVGNGLLALRHRRREETRVKRRGWTSG